MRALFAHWELKLVAVVVAVALYTYTSGQVRVERTMAVAVTDSAVRGLPPEFQVTGIEPREFKVQLSVPVGRATDLEQTSLNPRLEIEGDQLANGVASFALTSHVLRLPNDIRIIATEPADVRELVVHFDRIAEAELPVEPPRLVGLAAGLEAEITVRPTLVQVRAPGPVLERLLQDHHRVRFQEIGLGHVDPTLAAPVVESAVLVPLSPPAESPFEVVGKVEAKVDIRPLPGLSKSLTIPVQVLGDPELLRAVRVELEQSRLVLEIRGPENVLRSLTGEHDVVAWVAVSGTLETGVPHALPITVTCPPGVSAEHPPGSMSVTLVPQGERP